MSYLFDRAIEAALRNHPSHDAEHLKLECEKKTQKLVGTHRRAVDHPGDHAYAEALIFSMGGQFKPAQGDWAGNYVENWRMVSSNAGIIRGLVSSELQTAYALGLDIRSEAVIGKIFNLAVLVWSILGDYSSPPQDGGRR